MMTSPMRVVSDADVLIHLSKLHKLVLLSLLYSEVAIPEYVRNEIMQKENRDIRDALGSYIVILATSGADAEEIARRHGIHVGEAHVKALGETLKPCLFLSNERKVRKAAIEEDFTVVGTIGVILRAVHVGKLSDSEALALLESMKSEEFRIHPDLIQEAMTALQ